MQDCESICGLFGRHGLKSIQRHTHLCSPGASCVCSVTAASHVACESESAFTARPCMPGSMRQCVITATTRLIFIFEARALRKRARPTQPTYLGSVGCAHPPTGAKLLLGSNWQRYVTSSSPFTGCLAQRRRSQISFPNFAMHHDH